MTSEKILAFARMTRKENGDGKTGMMSEKMLALLRQSSAQVAGMT